MLAGQRWTHSGTLFWLVDLKTVKGMHDCPRVVLPLTLRQYSFLGYVDLLGTTYSSSTLATGYGAYIAQPLLRKAVEGNETTLTEEAATKIIETCMKVLFYRDARSLNKVCNGLPHRLIKYSNHRHAVPNRNGHRERCTHLGIAVN